MNINITVQQKHNVIKEQWGWWFPLSCRMSITSATFSCPGGE